MIRTVCSWTLTCSETSRSPTRLQHVRGRESVGYSEHGSLGADSLSWLLSGHDHRGRGLQGVLGVQGR
jgi:hypothetical protein